MATDESLFIIGILLWRMGMLIFILLPVVVCDVFTSTETDLETTQSIKVELSEILIKLPMLLIQSALS